MISGSSASLKPSVYFWNFLVHILLKPSLKDFENNLTSIWSDWRFTVVWTCFGIALLWDCNENWPFPVLWPLLIFQTCWHIECSTITASSFKTLNSSAGIPSPPLALLIVRRDHFTSHCWMSDSRWVNTSSWLSWSLDLCFHSSFVYSCHLFLISSHGLPWWIRW